LRFDSDDAMGGEGHEARRRRRTSRGSGPL